jgi:Ca2+-binding EF-hand superfamily protein
MAMAGHAAVAARKKRQGMEKRAAEEHEMLNSWFESYDKSHTGQFEREELRALLTGLKRKITGDAAAVVRDTMLDKVMKQYATQTIGQAEPGVNREDALKAVKKYKALLRTEAELLDLFDAADRDHSGVLTREQLRTFLASATRLKAGKDVAIGDEDVDFILARCDLSQEGTINMDEAVPAVATWLSVLPERQASKSSSACALL